MKAHLFFAITALAATFLVVGCASHPQTVTTTKTSSTKITDPSNRTYTQGDLNRSGHTRVGSDLQQIDPDIQAQGNR